MKLQVRPVYWGVLAGLLIVGIEAVGGFYPPTAYGLCLTCHLRDLINTLSNGLFGTVFPVSAIGRFGILLSTPMFLLGAFLAARLGREFRPRRPVQPIRMFLYGMIFMVLGIVFFGCPTRLATRTGYGDIYGAAGFLGVVAGVLVMTRLKLRRNR